MSFRIGITIGDVGRARRRSARRRRQHRRKARGAGRSRRHLRFTRGARAGRQQAVGAVRRYRRAGGEEYSDAGPRLYGGDAARGRNLLDAAAEKARRCLDGATPNWMWPLAVTVICLVAIGVAAFLFFTRRNAGREGENTLPARQSGWRTRRRRHRAAPAPAAPPSPSGERLVEDVPFIADRARRPYEPICRGRRSQGGGDHTRSDEFVTNQSTEEAARSAALDLPEARRTDRSRRENANFMRSATRWFIRTAVRRCRRRHGSRATLRPKSR